MKVAEIFESVNGECNGHHQGRLVTFIRLSGCNLKCSYCDTVHTQNFNYGEELSLWQILKKIKALGNKYICLTGGEPLIYSVMTISLLKMLWSEGYKISVETNGTISITPFFRFVESFVIDYKISLPSIMQRIDSNYQFLRKTDVIKFVVKDKEEAIQAFYIKEQLEIYGKEQSKAIIAFSPVMPGLTPATLFELLKKHKVRNSVLSLQIHKIVGFR